MEGTQIKKPYVRKPPRTFRFPDGTRTKDRTRNSMAVSNSPTATQPNNPIVITDETPPKTAKPAEELTSTDQIEKVAKRASLRRVSAHNSHSNTPRNLSKKADSLTTVLLKSRSKTCLPNGKEEVKIDFLDENNVTITTGLLEEENLPESTALDLTETANLVAETKKHGKNSTIPSPFTVVDKTKSQNQPQKLAYKNRQSAPISVCTSSYGLRNNTLQKHKSSIIYSNTSNIKSADEISRPNKNVSKTDITAPKGVNPVVSSVLNANLNRLHSSLAGTNMPSLPFLLKNAEKNANPNSVVYWG